LEFQERKDLYQINNNKIAQKKLFKEKSSKGVIDPALYRCVVVSDFTRLYHPTRAGAAGETKERRNQKRKLNKERVR